MSSIDPAELDHQTLSVYGDLEACLNRGDIPRLRSLLSEDVDQNVTYSSKRRTLLAMAAEFGSVEALEALFDANCDPDIEDFEGKTPLMLAVIRGHVLASKMLISYGSSLNARDDNGMTVLMWAAVYNRKELMRLLIKKKANVCSVDADGMTPLIFAAKYGHALACETLIDNRADVDACDDNRRTALMFAGWRGHADVVGLLLKHRAEVNHFNDDFTPGKTMLDNGMRVSENLHNGYRPVLMLATIRGFTEVADMVAGCDGDPDFRDIHNRTALHWAARGGHREIAFLLLQLKCDVNHADMLNCTPLMYACEHGHAAVALMLLDAGASVNVADNQEGRTALMRAVAQANTELAQLLLARGAKPNHVDNSKVSALMLACVHGDATLVQVLLEAKASVSAAEEHKMTALMFAAERGDGDMLELLLQHKASSSAADHDKWTALFYAAQMGHLGAARILLERGASPDAVDAFGQTPLCVAAFHGHAALVQLILDGAFEYRGKLPLAEDGRPTGKRLLNCCTRLAHTDAQGRSPLLLACLANHTAVVELLLSRYGANPIVWDQEHRNALCYCCEGGAVGCARAIVQHISEQAGAGEALLRYLDSVDSRKQTALMHACQRAEHGMVQLLLEHRADTAPRDEAGRCALQYALCSRLQRCAELLLAHAHDPTPPGLARNNQLLSSSAEGDAALARQLISAHADVNFVDPQLRTPLLRGASAGHLPTLHVLMKYGANPRMADEGGQTALMGAVLGAHVETVEALLAYCRTFEGEEEDGVKRLDFANINSAGESTASLSPPPTEAPRVGAVARSPAERQVSFRCGAVFFDQSGIAYEYQADNDAESSLSPHSVHSTLSALSAGSGFPSMTRAGSGNTGSVSDSSVSANAPSPSPPPLLTADSLSAVDSGPGSPLPTLAAAHTPIPQEQPPAPARRARGAVVDVVDADHRSALMLAAGRGDKELVKILLAHKANVSIVDFNNDTALTIAIKNRHVKVAKKLIGAMPDGDTKLDCSNIIFHSILQPMELDDRRTLVKLLMGKRLHGHETLKYLLKKL